jgi:hypothetical protein
LCSDLQKQHSAFGRFMIAVVSDMAPLVGSRLWNGHILGCHGYGSQHPMCLCHNRGWLEDEVKGCFLCMPWKQVAVEKVKVSGRDL